MKKCQGSELLSNVEIVAAAVYLLGGEAGAVDIEDIAVRASGLAPGRFSWRKYPDFIDIRLVQYALKDACSANHGLLTGSIRRGYMLTGKGATWARNLRLGQTPVDASRRQSVEHLLERERRRLTATTAYLKFTSGRKEEISRLDFEEFARVNDYFPLHVQRERFARIENAIRGDGALEHLWGFLKTSFVDRSEKG